MKKGLFLMGMLLGLMLFCCGCTTNRNPGRPVPLTPIPIPTKGPETVTPTFAPYVPNYDPVDYLMTEDNVKPIGRTYYDRDVRWCGYSGSGVEFFFAGRECTIHFKSDDRYDNPGHEARVAVFVDGERAADFLMDAPEKSVKVIDSGTDTIATVRVVKLSEVSDSFVGLDCVTVVGAISPLSSLPTRIEFVGDSITCGYGVDGEFEKDVYATSNEDCTKAYAYKTAQRLNADYSLVSISGFGIVSGYTATGEKQADKILPPYYLTIGKSDALFGSDLNAEEITWDFDSFRPDIVVINLGTNDQSYCKDEAKRREYIDGYKEFLKTVREKNPDAKIICTLGIMGTDLCPSMETAVREYKEQSGDENITTFLFEEQDQAKDGVAVDWHPSEATHEKAAKKLADFITELLREEW